VRKHTICFQRVHPSRIGRVVVDLHHPWHRIARYLNRIAQKAFGRGLIAFGCEQKVNSLPRGIDSAIHIFVAALYLYIGRVDTVTLVGRLQLWSAGVYSARVHTPAPSAKCNWHPPLKGFCGAIGIDFHPSNPDAVKVRNEAPA
jgi:hypothetical protein